MWGVRYKIKQLLEDISGLFEITFHCLSVRFHPEFIHPRLCLLKGTNKN